MKLEASWLNAVATIEYFGPQHLPFAVLALAIGFVFVVLPCLLLVLYPCACFQRGLNWLGVSSRWPGLHIFMDAFQGNYRTEPRDLRYFSAFYLFLRIIVFVAIISAGTVCIFPFFAFVITLGTLVFATFQPYKNKKHNRLDIISLLTMATTYLGLSSIVVADFLDNSRKPTTIVITFGSFTFFFLLFTGSLGWVFFHKLASMLVRLSRCIYAHLRPRNFGEDPPQDIEAFDRDEERPGYYPPLLH